MRPPISIRGRFRLSVCPARFRLIIKIRRISPRIFTLSERAKVQGSPNKGSGSLIQSINQSFSHSITHKHAGAHRWPILASLKWSADQRHKLDPNLKSRRNVIPLRTKKAVYTTGFVAFDWVGAVMQKLLEISFISYLTKEN